MSPHDRRIVLDKLPVSALSIPSQKKKKTALVALGGVLLVGCFLIVYNLAGYYKLRSRDALHTSRMEACEEAVLEGKISFWLKNMPDDKIVCQMYAEAYSEMVGEVGHGVPKIIHQSWKTVDVTDDFRIWLSSWREANPDHEHWFWTDEDNREMVARYYPQFLETYGTFRAVLPPRAPCLAHTDHLAAQQTPFPRVSTGQTLSARYTCTSTGASMRTWTLGAFGRSIRSSRRGLGKRTSQRWARTRSFNTTYRMRGLDRRRTTHSGSSSPNVSWNR